MSAPYETTQVSRLRRAAVDFNSTGDNTVVVAPSARKRVQIYQIFFVVNATTIVRFKSGAGTDLSGPIPLAAGAAFVLDNNREPWLVTAEGEDFVINQTGTAQFGGTVGYYAIDVGVPGAS